MEKTKFDGDSVESLDAAIAKQFASENVSRVSPKYSLYKCQKLVHDIKRSVLAVHTPYIFCFIARHGMEALPQDHCQTFRHDLHVLLLRHLPRPHGHGVPTCDREGGLLTILREQTVQQSLLWSDGWGFGGYLHK